MIEKAKNILKYIVSAGLAVLLLYVAFRGVSWSDFFSGLMSCKWVLVLLSMLCGLVAFAFRAERWRQLLKPIDDSITFRAAFNAINIGNISNFLFPFLGEVTRTAVISRNSKTVKGEKLASFDKVFGTAILERGWDVLTVIVFLGILLVFKWDVFGAFMIEKIWIPMKSVMGLKAIALLAAVALAAVAGLWLVYHFRHRSKLCGKFCGAVKGFLQGLGACLKVKRKGLFMAYTLMIWIMYWLESVFVTAALPDTAGLDLADALFIMLIGSFASCLPLPGGMGGYHVIIRSALTLIFGVSASVGIVYALLAHESQTLLMIIAGAVSYIDESLHKRKTSSV